MEGADGACRHVAASLYAIEGHDCKSVTDGPCLWKKRPMAHNEPVPISKLKIVKARYSKKNISAEKDQFFDPREVNDRGEPTGKDIANFAKEMNKVNPEARVLDFLREPVDTLITTDVSTKINDITPLSVINKTAQLIEKNGGQCSNITSNDFLSHMKYNKKEIDDIAMATIGQSCNPLWFDMRKGLLTASVFKDVCRQDSEMVDKVMGKAKPFNKFQKICIDWGVRKEAKARDLYRISESKKHVGFQVTETGLQISKEHPFIACSSDGLVTCSCHQSKLIEIKCPFVWRNINQKDASCKKGCFFDKDTWFLSPTSDYYHQIQGQLGVYTFDQCDLVIYTLKGIHVITVPFDKDFYTSMVFKLKSFYEKFIIPRLLSSVCEG